MNQGNGWETHLVRQHGPGIEKQGRRTSADSTTTNGSTPDTGASVNQRITSRERASPVYVPAFKVSLRDTPRRRCTCRQGPRSKGIDTTPR